jgi:hypothetical protein
MRLFFVWLRLVGDLEGRHELLRSGLDVSLHLNRPGHVLQLAFCTGTAGDYVALIRCSGDYTLVDSIV